MADQNGLLEFEDAPALLAGLFANSPVAFQVYGRDGHCRYVNRAFEELFGSKPPPEYNVLHDDILARAGMLDLIHRAFAGETVHVPVQWYDPRELRQVEVLRGRRVAIEVVMFPLFDRQVQVHSVALCIKDVTAEMELKQAQRRLRESETSLAAAQRMAHLGSWELDLANLEDVNANPLRWSDEVFRIFGYEPGGIAVTNESFFQAVHPDDRERIAATVRAALDSGTMYQIDHRILRPDGSERIVHEQSEIQYDPATGRPLRMVGTVQDVTEHRRAAAALRASEERYRTLVEHAPEAIVVLDAASGRYIDANGNAERLFGLPRARLCQLRPADVSPPSQPDGRASEPTVRAYLARALNGEAPVFEWTHRHASGRDFPCDVRLVNLPSVGEALIRGSIIDITERKRLEELRVRSDELEMENRRIQEANRLKSEFLATMSHELRTPLNAIIGFAELLYDGHVHPDAAEHKEFLGDILTSGHHLLRLINDVLDLAKVEAGRLEFHPEPLDLARCIAEVCAVLRTKVAEKRIVVDTLTDPALLDVVLDAIRFKQVLYNYLSNALKFTPEGGRVTVRALADGKERFRLEVEDTGPGIAPEDLGRLFTEFQQLSAPADGRRLGTGLGLALTKRLVEAQNGSVGVDSIIGKGCVFYAVLPRRGRPEPVRTI